MKIAIGILSLALLFLGACAAVGPREPVDLSLRFDAASLPEDLDGYLAAREDGIAPDMAARILWNGAPGAQTDWAVVYLHGYSATSEEIRPVPDQVARALGANLYFTRLTGHGQDGEAMAKARVQDWMDDTAEALAIGRRIGKRVLVISTSTGGTLAAEAARHPDLAGQFDALVMVSPNFAIRNPASQILTWPLVRYWGPVVAGKDRCFEPVNDAHDRYWTNCYPTVAVLPVAALAEHARSGDYRAAHQPVLVLISQDDQVVSPEATRRAMASWGGPAMISQLSLGPQDDPYRHVLAGDVLSPSMTGPVSEAIVTWLRGAIPQ